MTLGQMAVLALAIVTFGFAFGGAAGAVISPTPVSSLGPGTMVLSYAILPGIHGGPAIFTPYVTVIPHPGWVQVYVANQDGSVHAYLLSGTGLLVTSPSHMLSMTNVYLSHPGQYTWVNFLATPGVPFGVTVGVLIVR